MKCNISMKAQPRDKFDDLFCILVDMRSSLTIISVKRKRPRVAFVGSLDDNLGPFSKIF